jgi:hypothetical protein
VPRSGAGKIRGGRAKCPMHRLKEHRRGWRIAAISLRAREDGAATEAAEGLRKLLVAGAVRQTVGEVGELADADAERAGDSAHGRPGWIGPRSLDANERGDREVRGVREVLLRELAVVAELADCLRERWLRIGRPSHPLDRRPRR